MLFQLFSCNHFFDIFSALEVGSSIYQKDCLQNHRALFLEKLDPTLTADYLFQYEVFDIHTHDEIEQSTQTHKKIESILLHLEKKSNDEFNIFMEVLKISKQEFILNELRKREGSGKKKLSLKKNETV